MFAVICEFEARTCTSTFGTSTTSCRCDQQRACFAVDAFAVGSSVSKEMCDECASW